MRKFVSLVLVFIFALTLPSAALASNFYSYADHSVDVISQEAFSNIFGVTSVDSIYYNYSFDTTSSNNSRYVTVDFAMHINNKIYYGFASGPVTGVTLNTEILWEGPIFGYLTVGKNDYPMIIGFAKLESSNKIQLAISCTIETNVSDYVIYVSAGDSVITNEMYQSIVNDNSFISNNVIFDADSNTDTISSRGVGDRPIIWDGGSTPEYGTYALKLYHSYPLDENSTVTGGGMSVYFSDDYNCVAVSIHSFCDNIRSTHVFPGTITGTSVKSISYRLTSGNSTPQSHSVISGIQHFGFEPNNYNILNTPLSPLFQDILGIFGVPTSTISAILENFSGKVSRSAYTDDYTVTIDFSVTDGVNFDSLSRGLPIVFQLLKATDSYEGDSLYTATTSITYLSSVVFLDGVGFPVFYTEHVSEMEATFEVTLR